jgi:hypothetical protein
MKFISIVGTQVMAVLNPILALAKQGTFPFIVELLVTDHQKSMQLSKNIEAHLIRKLGFHKESVRISEISSTLATDKNGRLPANEAVKRFIDPNEEFYFNLAGGMNFQIAGALLAVDLESANFVYPDSEGIHVIRLKAGKIFERSRLALPQSVTVLDLQGFEYDVLRQNLSGFLMKVIHSCKLESWLEMADKQVCIKGVVFDLVWNNGNELKFLKVIRGSANDKKKSRDCLQCYRKVVALLQQRDDFADLYHRDVAILTDSRKIAERISTEGKGKVEVILARGGDFCLNFEKFLSISEDTPSEATKFTLRTGRKELSENPALIVSIGQNIMTTLIAIWSHRPSRVIFAYTPEDKVISELRKYLETHSSNLPVESVTFYPVGMTGGEIMRIKPGKGIKTIVNISAGTKWQTALMCLWARKYGAEVYSIETTTQELRRIPSGTGGGLSAPSPVDFLKFAFGAVPEPRSDNFKLSDDWRLQEGVLDFLRRLNRDRTLLQSFPSSEIRIGRIKYVPSGPVGRIFDDSKRKPIEIYIGNGNWFEELVGYVFCACGADDVAVGTEIPWSEETQKVLSEKYGQMPHMNEIDVVGRFRSDYFVVSCKATRKEDEVKRCTEIKAVASLFGRFAVPMLCFLRYGGNPYTKNGVTIFGCQTLTDKDKTKALLKQAMERKRTTLPQRAQFSGYPNEF